MSNNFIKRFKNSIDYPECSILLNGVARNEIFNYVSHQYLDGFINYTSSLKAILINRYSNIHSRVDTDSILFNYKIRDPDKPYIYKKTLDIFKDKDVTVFEFINYIRNCSFRQTINKLSIFEDDILLLRKIENVKNEYMFFWYDFDVSDCSIGRISLNKDETEEQLINEFLEYCKDRNNSSSPSDISERIRDEYKDKEPEYIDISNLITHEWLSFK